MFLFGKVSAYFHVIVHCHCVHVVIYFIFAYIPMLNKHTLTKFKCFAAFNIYSERITFGGFRGRRTDLVGGNCAGKHVHEAKRAGADMSWRRAGAQK